MSGQDHSSDATTSAPRALPTFDDFVAKTGVLARIDSINLFRFTVRYQNNGALEDARAVSAVRANGYAVLNDLLERAGIHYLEVLEAEVSNPRDATPDGTRGDEEATIKFRFKHDLHHCEFSLLPDRFTITRQSSSLDDFYKWYQLFMPEALRVETTLRSIAETATSASLRAVQSSFDFRFNFGDFRKPPIAGGEEPAKRMRNMDVLEQIIPSLPANREMVSLSKQHFYRLDLTLSQLQAFSAAKHRNTWYYVEAPFNENGRYIVFRAELRNGANEIIEDGKVVDILAFDPNYGEDYYIALVEFLRDRALEGFLYQLLSNWHFSTERLL